MAHIAIDARKYFDYGIGSYIQNLIRALAELNTSHSFTLFASTGELAGIEVPKGWNKTGSSHRKYSLGEVLLLGRDARSGNADLFHEPHYTLPTGLRGRSVVTVHDLIHVRMPQYFTVAQRGYARVMLGHAVRHAGALIAVSQKTKEDIMETFNAKERDVTVIYHGVKASFRTLDDRSRLKQFRLSHGLERPFLLYVGNVKPHKNIPMLLAAFSQVRSRFKSLDLAFAGGSCLEDATLREQARLLGITEAIHDLHRLQDDDLVCAYNASEALVLPSLYEGFGFPALEAMACGTAAIVSNAGSLPEIVGEAALIIDPARPESLADAITVLLNDSEQKALLIAKGREHVKNFSWDTTARQTLSIYEKVLSRWHAN